MEHVSIYLFGSSLVHLMLSRADSSGACNHRLHREVIQQPTRMGGYKCTQMPVVPWEISSRETCESYRNLVLVATYGSKRQRERRELQFVWENADSVQRSQQRRGRGFFVIRLAAPFWMAVRWELQERPDSMDRALHERDAQRAGFLCRSWQDPSRR